MNAELRTKYETRLLANRLIQGECWIWTKSLNDHGYGQTCCLPIKRVALVHRVSAWLWKDFDLFSSGLVLHHCDHPACFNPDHLYVGTHKQNTADMVARGRARGRPHLGEENGCAVLTESQVLEIRTKCGPRATRPHGTLARLSREYGMSYYAIWAIASGRLWKHLL